MLVAEGYEIFEVSRGNGFDLSKRNWTKFIPKKPFDYVIHLAQSAHYRDFPDGACDMMRINIEAATFELLEWNRKHCAGSFLFASTGTVYRQKPNAITEKDVAAPSSFYGATKLWRRTADRTISSLFSYSDHEIIRCLWSRSEIYGNN